MADVTMKIGEPETAPLTAPTNVTAVTTPEGTVITKTETTPVVPETKTADRPAGLPDKFKTVEEMAKSYGELEKKLGAPAAPALPAGIDVNAIASEYAANGGKLTDATQKSLADKGVTKATLDTFIAGQQAIHREQTATLAEVVGGPDKLTNVLSWAKTGLSAAEIKAYDSMIDSNNIEGAKLLLGSIAQKYVAANGNDPKLITGVTVPSQSGAKPFESSAQVVAAMKDKRYETDSAYRKSVSDRLAVTNNIFGKGH